MAVDGYILAPGLFRVGFHVYACLLTQQHAGYTLCWSDLSSQGVIMFLQGHPSAVPRVLVLYDSTLGLRHGLICPWRPTVLY
jgi:hypothetical protein